MAKKTYNYSYDGIGKNRSFKEFHLSKKCSIPFGYVYPLGFGKPVIPWTTTKADIKGILRMLTPKVPIMDGIEFEIISVFVPTRLVWNKTKQFYGENDQVAFTMPQNLKKPVINFKCDYNTGLAGVYTSDDAGNYHISVLARDTFGPNLLEAFALPFQHITSDQFTRLRYSGQAGGLMTIESIVAEPFRAYQLVCNMLFRNQMVVDPRTDYLYDNSDKDIRVDDSTSAAALKLWRANKKLDLYTACWPSPQRGDSVNILAGLTATVDTLSALQTYNSSDNNKLKQSLSGNALFFGTLSGTDKVLASAGFVGHNSNGSRLAGDSNFSGNEALFPANLITKMETAGLTVPMLRKEIATQQFLESVAKAQTMKDYIRVFFGRKPSASELDYPIFCGSVKGYINVSQVATTADTQTGNTGDVGALSVTGIKGHLYTKTFEEQGLVQTYIIIRKSEHNYVQGLDPYWHKRELLDEYNPIFANFGFVNLPTSSIYWNGKGLSGQSYDDVTFGFTFYGYEYVSSKSEASGLMNPLAPDNLSFYALTDVFAAAPVLEASFVQEDDKGLDNALIYSGESYDQFYGAFEINYLDSVEMPVVNRVGLNRI